DKEQHGWLSELRRQRSADRATAHAYTNAPPCERASKHDAAQPRAPRLWSWAVAALGAKPHEPEQGHQEGGDPRPSPTRQGLDIADRIGKAGWCGRGIEQCACWLTDRAP